MLHKIRYFFLLIGSIAILGCWRNPTTCSSCGNAAKNQVVQPVKIQSKPGLGIILPQANQTKNLPSGAEDQDVVALEHLANDYRDPYAMLKLGEIYLNGNAAISQNLSVARTWFLKAAEHGLALAMIQLGNMARDGTGEQVSLAKAIKYYEKAAHLGNVKAMLTLSEIYCNDYAGKPDYNLAMEWNAKAAGMGSLEAEYNMARLINAKLVDQTKYTVKVTTIKNSLSKASERGDPRAMIMLGDYYASNDLNSAIKSYKQATKYSDTAGQAYLKLGLIYFNGENNLKDPLKAIAYFTQAANANEVAANYYLGEIYRRGLGGNLNHKLAAQYYAVAAEKNFIKALVKLADAYFRGKGVEPNILKAKDLYLQAATKTKDSYASFILSIFYAKGIEMAPSLSHSVHWYKLGEQQPDQLFAKFEIGRLYEMGLGLKQDYTEAIKWYLLAANDGLAAAQVKLADLYASDVMADPNLNQAIMWYNKAAGQGYNYAQYSLGLLLQNKESSLYKPNLAYRFMKKSALNGYKPAQYSLALMYLDGIGTKINAIKAYCWLNLALSATGGYESNPELMDIVINKLDFKAREKAVLLEKNYTKQSSRDQTIADL